MSKDKEKRLEEKEKLDAETQRSYAVAEMKKAHKLIEETEKSRKRPSIRSVCSRIDFTIKDFLSKAKMFSNDPFGSNKISNDLKILIQGLPQIYESIRYDLQKTTEIKDEDMAKLFPKIEIDIENVEKWYTVSSYLYRMEEQLRQMKLYCERIL